MLTQIQFENFTAFKDLKLDFSPGINVFTGVNGTGKTHIMKAAYAACDISVSHRNFADKLEKVFYPSNYQFNRLSHRAKGSVSTRLVISRSIDGQINHLNLKFSSHTLSYEKSEITGAEAWKRVKLPSVYIPVKDMMANAPGFRSLYTSREIHFEEIYDDIIARAFLGTLKGPVDAERKKLLTILQKSMDGQVIVKNEEFFLKNNQGELEFTLLAEGIRKLALLWTLIQNGSLLNGAVLFWDEPEANLNPSIQGVVVDILLALQRMGVQIFIATHDYIFLKWLAIKMDSAKDRVLFHALYKEGDGEIRSYSTPEYNQMVPNSITASFAELYDAELEKGFSRYAD